MLGEPQNERKEFRNHFTEGIEGIAGRCRSNQEGPDHHCSADRDKRHCLGKSPMTTTGIAHVGRCKSSWA